MSSNLYFKVAIMIYLYLGAAKSRHTVFADNASPYKGDHQPVYQTDTKVLKSSFLFYTTNFKQTVLCYINTIIYFAFLGPSCAGKRDR